MLKPANALGVTPRMVHVPGLLTAFLAAVIGPMSTVDQRFYGPHLRCYLASPSSFYNSSKAAKSLGDKLLPFERILEECVTFLRMAENV
jgi:hypothetical protein